MRVSRTIIPARPGRGSSDRLCTTPSPRISLEPSLSTNSKVTLVPSGLGARVAMNTPPRATWCP